VEHLRRALATVDVDVELLQEEPGFRWWDGPNPAELVTILHTAGFTTTRIRRRVTVYHTAGQTLALLQRRLRTRSVILAVWSAISTGRLRAEWSLDPSGTDHLPGTDQCRNADLRLFAERLAVEETLPTDGLAPASAAEQVALALITDQLGTLGVPGTAGSVGMVCAAICDLGGTDRLVDIVSRLS
jgi:hypothetical protein